MTGTKGKESCSRRRSVVEYMRRSLRKYAAGAMTIVLVALMSGAFPGTAALAGNVAFSYPTASGSDAVAGGEAAPVGEIASESDADSVFEETLECDLATPASLTLRRAAVGDLWEDWNGDMDFPGDGTETEPYQISGIAHLMGLSEAVAAGEDFRDTWFELTGDIDLGGLTVHNGNWNPIGWYRNRAEMAGDVATPFRGHFDGGGHTVSGLKIINPEMQLRNIGLFGVIDGGTVKNLTVEADDIYGAERAAVLVGTLSGGAVIYGVNVSGYVYATGDIGGIAAAVIGDSPAVGTVAAGNRSAVIENCRAEGIILNSAGSEGFTGGIAGNVQRAWLVDNTVITQNGDYNRIQGKGYVGGIAGRLRESSVYNAYVNGTIGGNGSRAAGGIIGKYESGNLVLARMAGDISRTNNGSASREGTFVGTRESRDYFTYGTGRDSRIAYLFTTSAAKAKNVFGSSIDGDNSYTEQAHIGYWTDLERKYVTVSGRIETGCGERYFYEELEDGVRYIVTQKLGREFTMDGYRLDLPFALDHFAPGYMGEPVRGYLVYIPRIDARNANGTYDTDVAELAAMPETGSSYYREIDREHPAAVVPGAVVTVATAPKNSGQNRYQMIVDASADGGVRAPTYRDEAGEAVPMNYVNGGAYSFVMPECDTELKAEYRKVTTRLDVEPAETRISVVQTRNGDRKHPQVVTEVKNEDGILIARYIEESRDRTLEAQPVLIHAEHNGTGQTADRTVRWSVDDDNLLENHCESGYTMMDAAVLPNLNSAFIQGIINREVQAQAENRYREKINDTIYTRYAVVTATTNPATSVNNQPVYGNCRVAVEFRIIDNTTVRVEEMSLNRTEAELTVTRRLTGSCYRPTERITCSAPVVLTAFLNPTQPFYRQVGWNDRESGKIVRLTPSGTNMQDCRLEACFDAAGEANPAWIQNIINEDKAKKAANPLRRVNGSGQATEIVTATSEDQTHGNVTAECLVTVRFVTVDETTPRSGGSSGGFSGGGGGSFSGLTVAGASTAAGASLPGYAVSGTWIRNAAGKWTFSDGSRAYTNEWAAVVNPYADTYAGQSDFDWFFFGSEGIMMTGWHQDSDGNTYYLNSSPDGTQGRMYTGWNWITGADGVARCYYFNESSDGTRGALKRNHTTDDGSRTDQDGAWVVDGVVQTRHGA